MERTYRTEWQNRPTSTAAFITANMPEDFERLSAAEVDVLLDWFWRSILPHRTKGFRSIRNSYRLKHNFEYSEGGFPITNGQFKGAALLVGLEPEDPGALNWRFPLGKKAGQDVTIKKPKARGRLARTFR